MTTAAGENGTPECWLMTRQQFESASEASGGPLPRI